jgi:glutathione synthase/RimK-type ligase-like ATP-grasp enzyme
VRGFLRKWKGRVLFKELSHALVRFRTAFANGFDARRLRTAPISLQQYIEKEYDVRAVVVGDSVFACRIDSQASEMAKVDWRVWDSAHVRWDRMRLPRSVERAILRLMRRLHLLWGSVDLAKSTDGGFYFFEVNRPGSQYWLLPYVGLDVTKEIAAYLDRVLRR